MIEMSLNENEKKVKKDKNYSQKTNPLNIGYCNSGQDRKCCLRTTFYFVLLIKAPEINFWKCLST